MHGVDSIGYSISSRINRHISYTIRPYENDIIEQQFTPKKIPLLKELCPSLNESNDTTSQGQKDQIIIEYKELRKLIESYNTIHANCTSFQDRCELSNLTRLIQMKFNSISNIYLMDQL